MMFKNSCHRLEQTLMIILSNASNKKINKKIAAPNWE